MLSTTDAQRALFPDVCSDSTLYRSIRELQPDVLTAVKAARAAMADGDPWRDQLTLYF